MSGIWDCTVTIVSPDSTPRHVHISSTRDAAAFLLEHWPGSKDDVYEKAIALCSHAIKGVISDHYARLAFVRAASASSIKHLSTPRLALDDFDRDIIREVRKSLLADLMNPLRSSDTVTIS
jgi:hypothetical protein